MPKKIENCIKMLLFMAVWLLGWRFHKNKESLMEPIRTKHHRSHMIPKWCNRICLPEQPATTFEYAIINFFLWYKLFVPLIFHSTHGKMWYKICFCVEQYCRNWVKPFDSSMHGDAHIWSNPSLWLGYALEFGLKPATLFAVPSYHIMFIPDKVFNKLGRAHWNDAFDKNDWKYFGVSFRSSGTKCRENTYPSAHARENQLENVAIYFQQLC